MKVIDLLNKIANGEEVPEKIKYDKIDYSWCDSCKIYERIEDFTEDLYNDIDSLNDEVEIIEEDKKIEKLDEYVEVSGDIAREWSFSEKKLKDKIDELIDEVNKLKDDNK